MDNHSQNNGQVFATQNNGQVFATQNNGQVFHAQNNGQELDTQFPFGDQGPPRPTYPPPYTTVPQQQNASWAGKCENIMAGRISTIWLGSLLLFLGAMSQVGAAVAMRYFAGLSEVGAGIWCGYMFMAGGAVAIAVGHHETTNLIIGTIFASAFTIIASIILLAITATGLTSDIKLFTCHLVCDEYTPWYYCPCYYDNWAVSAVVANSAIIFAAYFAFVAGLWLLIVASIAIRRSPASFQQAYSAPVQYVQQPQQQLIPLSHLPPDTAYQPTFSQMHSIPGQYVLQQQQYQQQIPLNYLQHYSIAPSTLPPQGQDNHALTQADADDAVTALES